MDLIEGSETPAIINQTPGNYPKENLLYSVHGESLKSRRRELFVRILLFPCKRPLAPLVRPYVQVFVNICFKEANM